MIDLHCHLLACFDDGAENDSVSAQMVRIALADGITAIVCTPHIMPGVYDNTGARIYDGVRALQMVLHEARIPISLFAGADVHMAPDLVRSLRDGSVLTINESRYLLFEPPHHVLPPRLEDCTFELMTAGYIPIITHPERLSWVDRNYELLPRLARAGVLLQLTAGSLTGRFGGRAQYWSKRMMDDGLCHLIATDAHNLTGRPPVLSGACEMLTERLGQEEACNVFLRRPDLILRDGNPADLRLRPMPATSRPRRSWRQSLPKLGRRRLLAVGG
ncbi:MAG: capsular biosynthesis protein [Methylobacteriaceae bacterium]|nr:capsular biosynthesis protein [Methylobacteriaceae bacterium]